jgi:WD40 repeat protein
MVNRVTFSPDGRTIATASADATVKLWNAATFRELVTLREPKRNRADLPEFIRETQNQVTAVAFTRDGKRLATGLVDGTVRLRRARQEANLQPRYLRWFANPSSSPPSNPATCERLESRTSAGSLQFVENEQLCLGSRASHRRLALLQDGSDTA